MVSVKVIGRISFLKQLIEVVMFKFIPHIFKVNKNVKDKAKMSPEEQLKSLKETFGTNMNYVDVVIPVTYSEVEQYYGKQCEEYEPLCACCNAWLEWQKSKKVTFTFSREELLNLLSKD